MSENKYTTKEVDGSTLIISNKGVTMARCFKPEFAKDVVQLINEGASLASQLGIDSIEDIEEIKSRLKEVMEASIENDIDIQKSILKKFYTFVMDEGTGQIREDDLNAFIDSQQAENIKEGLEEEKVADSGNKDIESKGGFPDNLGQGMTDRQIGSSPEMGDVDSDQEEKESQ